MRALLLALLAARPAAAASIWLAGEMTQPGPHPRSLASPADRALLQDRVTREPYGGLLRRMVSQAAREVSLTSAEVGVVQTRANTARAAAWLFWLDRTTGEDGAVVPFPTAEARDALGAKAVQYLRSMLTTSRSKGFVNSVDDIHTAQELHLWADTLDLLLGADRDALGEEREAAIQGVADLAADFWADFERDNWLYMRSLVNNHRSKSAAALGIAAIVLNGERFEDKADDGRYRLGNWVDFALRYVDFVVRDTLTDADGGYQEGGGYIVYSGIDHFPFEWAWHRYTGGASYRVVWDASVPPYHVTGATEPYVVPDLWTDPVLARQLLWSVRVMLPDGSFPPFDDSTPGSRLYFGAFVGQAFEHAGLFRWAWEYNAHSAGGSVETAPFLALAFDEAFPSVDPEAAGLGRHQVMPYAGQVVFRSGWGPDDVYVLLLAEHGKAAGWAQTRWGQYVDGDAGHEHSDGTSFMLYAGGEALVIDSGYLGWDDREKVNEPSNHNLVLVDGKGPEMPRMVVPPFELTETDVVLTDPSVEGGWSPARDGETWVVASDVETPGVAFAELVTTWERDVPRTEVRRRATFLDDRFVVLHDRLLTHEEPPQEHTYTHTLHLRCGGTVGGTWEPLEHGGLCVREDVRLRVLVLSELPATQATREDVHDERAWAERTHTVLETSVRGTAGEPVELLTLLLPERQHDGTWEELQPELGYDWATVASWQAGDLRCDARLPPLGPTPPDGGSTVGRVAACSSPSASSAVGDNHGRHPLWSQHVRHVEDGRATHFEAVVHAADGPAEILLPGVEGLEPDGACAWEPYDDYGWSVTAPVGVRIRTLPQARRLVAHLRLAGSPPATPLAVPLGEPVTVDASTTCGPAAAEDPVLVWTLDRRPELSQARLERAEGWRRALVPDLPGVYRVHLEARAGDAYDETRLAFEAVGEVPWEPPAPEAGEDAGAADGAEAGDAADAGPAPPPGRADDGCDCRIGGRAPARPRLPWRRR